MNELEKLVSKTREFVREVVIPAEPGWGETVDLSVLKNLREQAKEAGIYAPHVPQELGGLGLPISQWSPVFQEAGYSLIGPSALNIMAPDEGNMHMMNLIASEEQKERYLRPLVAGEWSSSFAMTEPHPGAGSDPSALKTTATKVTGGWHINGEKRFISGAEIAGFAIIMARTETGATMFLSPLDAPGITIGPSIETIEGAIPGGHPHVTFKDLFVSDENVLGAPGEGFKYAQVRLGPARLTHCMRWLGIARRSHDIALDRANTRELFGSKLADLGVASSLLADSAIDIETSDAIITKAAKTIEEDARRGLTLSSIAKVHCSEAIYRVVDRSVQLCGGDGVSSGLPLIQFLNEVRPFRIYDGSNETHRWSIAKRSAKSRLKETENSND